MSPMCSSNYSRSSDENSYATDPGIDSVLIKASLSRLTPSAFAAFTLELFAGSPGEAFTPLNEAGENAFFQPIPDSYGGSLHSVYIRHNSLSALFPPSAKTITRDPRLISSLRRVRALYSGKLGAWGMVSPYTVAARQLQTLAFLTDITGVSKEDYERVIIPRYTAAARKAGLRSPRILVGSPDSYLNISPEKTRHALVALLSRHSDGVRIALEDDHFVVQRFEVESALTAGVLTQSPLPYEPVYLLPTVPEDAILREFEFLPNSRSNEAQLERFLVANFQAVFGHKYDRIETQIWLPFPHLDISKRNRRADVFMRNAVTNDWELVELKRADVKLATFYRRDLPTLSHEIVGAVQQLRNYSRLLRQQQVRDTFARRGIEYFEPDVSLIVGRSPNISNRLWRWLMSEYRDTVRITTYGQLLEELRIRAAERRAMIVNAKP